MPHPSSGIRRRAGWATVVGLGAVVLWGSLAALAVSLGPFPPFELMAITFGIGGCVGVALSAVRGRLTRFRQPPLIWVLGIGAVFGDYALYFLSLRFAPAAQANLISYLWPLLMVLFSTRLPGETLLLQHVAGAALGLLGVAVLLAGEGGYGAFQPRYAAGYALAFGAAITWGGYSVLARRFAAVPHDVTFGFCLGTAVLAAAVHAGFEPTVRPSTVAQLVLLAAIGIGPAGMAYFLWDFGIKHGDIRVLGILSYTTPVLSTALLVLVGGAPAKASLGLACVLIALGAIVGTARTRAARRESPARPREPKALERV